MYLTKNNPRAKKGFTLVEVVMVALILSFVAVGIAGSFVSGMKLWNRALTLSSLGHDMALNLEGVAKEARQSLNFPEIGFEGNSSGLSFPIVNQGVISKVSYAFDPQKKAVIRGQVDLKSIREDKLQEGYTQKDVFSAEEFSARFMYFDTEKNSTSWADSWAKDKGIFTALQLQGRSKGEEFEKTIYIPVAQ